MVYEIRQAPTAGNKGKRKRELKEDINMASHSNEAVEVVPSLEPLPKWALVQNILEVSAEARSGSIQLTLTTLLCDSKSAESRDVLSAQHQHGT